MDDDWIKQHQKKIIKHLKANPDEIPGYGKRLCEFTRKNASAITALNRKIESPSQDEYIEQVKQWLRR